MAWSVRADKGDKWGCGLWIVRFAYERLMISGESFIISRKSL